MCYCVSATDSQKLVTNVLKCHTPSHQPPWPCRQPACYDTNHVFRGPHHNVAGPSPPRQSPGAIGSTEDTFLSWGVLRTRGGRITHRRLGDAKRALLSTVTTPTDRYPSTGDRPALRRTMLETNRTHHPFSQLWRPGWIELSAGRGSGFSVPLTPSGQEKGRPFYCPVYKAWSRKEKELIVFSCVLILARVCTSAPVESRSVQFRVFSIDMQRTVIIAPLHHTTFRSRLQLRASRSRSR